MGLGESKELNQELELFPTEEREILQDNFMKLSGGSKKIDRQTLEVFNLLNGLVVFRMLLNCYFLNQKQIFWLGEYVI